MQITWDHFPIRTLIEINIIHSLSCYIMFMLYEEVVNPLLQSEFHLDSSMDRLMTECALCVSNQWAGKSLEHLNGSRTGQTFFKDKNPNNVN